MKFTCNVKEMEKALNLVSACVLAKPPAPILAGLHIVAKDGKVVFHGVNDVFLGVNGMEADVKEEGEVLINSARFVELVKGSGGDDITVSTNKAYSAVSIKSGSTQFKFVPMKVEHFPAIPKTEGEDWEKAFSLPFKELNRLVKQTAFAIGRSADKKDLRAIFRGNLCIMEKDKLTFVGTNALRMAVASVPAEISEYALKRNMVVIPPGAMTAILRRTGLEGDDIVGVYFHKDMVNNDRIMFKGDGWSVVSQLVAGPIADVRGVIPKSCATSFTMERKELAGAITRMALVGGVDEGYSIIGMEIGDGRVRVYAQSPDAGSGEETVECETEGKPLNIAFNAGFWQDMLVNVPGEKVTLSFNNRLNPAMAKVPDDDSFVYVLTPVSKTF